MTSSFDNLPYEVLCRISFFLADYHRNLRQFRLINKRCQSAAEVYIYERLTLSSSFSPNDTLPYLMFVLKPQRAKLVKSLRIREKQFIATLDDGFFDMFPNIQRLHGSWSDDYLDWEHLSKTFTAERCKLKRIPDPCTCRDDSIAEYIKMLCNHRQTLERLDFSNMDISISHHILQSVINAQCTFPKLKDVTNLDLEQNMLGTLDATVDRCSLLKSLYVTFVGMRRSPSYRPDIQHQRIVDKVWVNSPCTGFLDICNYFLAKFPNVQNWHFSTPEPMDMEDEDEPIPFDDEVMNVWESFLRTKSKDISMHFVTTQSSTPKALDFFTKSYKLDVEICIQLLPIEDEHHHITDEIAFDLVGFSAKKSASATTIITISHNSNKLGHLLELIATLGQNVKNLSLDIQEDICGYTISTETRFEKMIYGGIIEYTLSNCPLLTTFVAKLATFQHLDCHATYPNLTTLQLDCGPDLLYKESLLLNLSYQVPNVKEFTIKCRLSRRSHYDESRKVTINMPYNSFDKLVVFDHAFSSRSAFEHVVVEIALPTQSQPIIRYFEKYELPNSNGINMTQYIEQTENPEMKARLDILITCKSIKSLKITSSDYSLPEVLF